MDTTVTFIPETRIEYSRWISSLETPVLGMRPRVWVGHFHQEDITLTTNGQSVVYTSQSTAHKYERNDPRNKLCPIPSNSKEQAMGKAMADLPIRGARTTGRKRGAAEVVSEVQPSPAPYKREPGGTSPGRLVRDDVSRMCDLQCLSPEILPSPPIRAKLIRKQQSDRKKKSKKKKITEELRVEKKKREEKTKEKEDRELQSEQSKINVKAVELEAAMQRTPLISIPRRQLKFKTTLVTDAKHVDQLIVAVSEHGEKCGGSAIRRERHNYIHNVGMAAVVKLRCTHGSDCKSWVNGKFNWNSSGTMRIKNKLYHTANAKFSFALAFSSGSCQQQKDSIRAQGMTPPGQHQTDTLLKEWIDPWILDRKASLQKAIIDDLMLKLAVVLGVDVCFDHPRGAQNATVTVIHEDRLVFTLTDSFTIANKKEKKLMLRVLKELQELGVDVSVIVIDQNYSNVNIIQSQCRVNAKNVELRSHPVRVAYDVWHSVKSMAKKMNKSVVGSAAKLRDLLMTPAMSSIICTETECEKFLTEVDKELNEKPSEFFSEVTTAFHGKGAADFIKIFSSVDQINEFYVKNGLRETISKEPIWAKDAVTAYNEELPATRANKKVSTILGFHIRQSVLATPDKLMRAVALAIQKHLPAAVPPSALLDGASSRPQLLAFLLKNLPATCFRGENYSSDFGMICKHTGEKMKKAALVNATAVPIVPAEDPAVAPALQSPLQTLPQPSVPPLPRRRSPQQAAADFKGSKAEAIFGGKGVKGGKKINKQNIMALSANKLKLLVEYLSSCEGVEDKGNLVLASPKDKKEEKQIFCISNMHVLFSLKDDLDVAIRLASEALVQRVHAFERYYKTLLRSINQTWGGVNDKAKVFILVNGLLNFGEHCDNNHDHCACYLWWVACTLGAEGYVPSAPYISQIVSNNGMRCNRLVVSIFKVLLKQFVYSTAMEVMAWRTCNYGATTLNESHHHHMCIWNPKNKHITASEYQRNEAMAFIAAQDQYEQRVRMQRVLRTNKHADTLVASNGQKRGVDKQYVLDGMRAMFQDDDLTQNHVLAKELNVKVLRDTRLARAAAQAAALPEEGVQLGLGPAAAKQNEAGDCSDGIGRGLQVAERRYSARPVAPFPFMNDKPLLVTDEQRMRLKRVHANRNKIKAEVADRKRGPVAPDPDLALEGDVSDDDECEDDIIIG
jgi:hypothetical protein